MQGDSGSEIEVPKSVRPIMLDAAEETSLGERRGAKKQYRYGNLHIREYDDKYLLHFDSVDPRKDPLGHLVRDSPETLLGIASAIYFGKKVASGVYSKKTGSRGAVIESLIFGALASLAGGYLGYRFGRNLKRNL
jgi:hypothetical protein